MCAQNKTWIDDFCNKVNDIIKHYDFKDELPSSLVEYAILCGDTTPIEEYISTGHTFINSKVLTFDKPIVWETRKED